jgi:hypothetical protein
MIRENRDSYIECADREYRLIFDLLLMGMAAWRAAMEERTLRKELRDYDAYMG